MNRDLSPSFGYGMGRVYAEFQFTAAGAGVVSTAGSAVGITGADIVQSMTHVGGSNTIGVTLKDGFQALIVAGAEVRDDANNGAYATVGSVTNENYGGGVTAGPSFNINYFTAGGTPLNDTTLVTGIYLVMRNTVQPSYAK